MISLHLLLIIKVRSRICKKIVPKFFDCFFFRFDINYLKVSFLLKPITTTTKNIIKIIIHINKINKKNVKHNNRLLVYKRKLFCFQTLYLIKILMNSLYDCYVLLP